MKSEPGTYALILKCTLRATIQVGQRLQIALKPGYYIYVGSAFGPGGVQSRVARHCRRAKPKHWHIDYLREYCNPFLVLCCYALRRLEHLWAEAFQNIERTVVVKGFGCSDCKCASHLFWSPVPPDVFQFSGIIGEEIVEISLSPDPSLSAGVVAEKQVCKFH